LEKLRVIKRLSEAGHRPGQLVPRTLGELRALSDVSRAVPATKGSRHDEVDALLELVRCHDAAALAHGLAVAEARHGLRDFVIEVAAPLAGRVGEAWMRGELRIFEEHLFTECVRTALHAALGGLPAAQHGARVLLATLPGEPHSLGLLMAQTLLTLIADIAAAAAAWRADIVALSVTGCMKRNLVLGSLAQLRAQLAAAVQLWVGGAAPALSRRQLDGVVRVPTLESIADALRLRRADT
jgi:hypothetical protein